ncbi:hypothetical protein [Brachyspira aalborgi]|uniref:Uncharacterized protein n=1 Tax=Brachyspira aalborgi TaxID=29522 RepID=A0A5C8G8G3_9SPIR|nr:hypothetical protein [Brachyspira aalborgi]TXJ58154.1 hypothetical protein EPJ76_01500 [Brachyspira aalborgi]
MKLFLLIPILFFLLSCLSIPKADLKDNNSKNWIENIKNKTVIDEYENIYRFNNKADMNVFAYGYYSKAIKYKLFKIENDKAFYYTITSLKSYIMTVLPNFNLYEINSSKSLFNLLNQNKYFDNNFKNKNIYIAIGLILKNNILYIAKNYSSAYKDKLNLWFDNNGYFKNEKWYPILNADWNSYPLPTEDDINWDNLYMLGEII